MTLQTGGLFRLAVLVALGGAFCAPAAHAQTGACPTGTAVVVTNGNVCITVDAVDYMATFDPGTGSVPTTVRLDLMLFAPGVNTATGTPTQVINIGKPAVNPQNAVWIVVPAVTSVPVGQQYKARVVAVGQPLTAGGPAQVSARSPESNPFLRLAPSPAPPAPTAVAVPGS